MNVGEDRDGGLFTHRHKDIFPVSPPRLELIGDWEQEGLNPLQEGLLNNLANLAWIGLVRHNES